MQKFIKLYLYKILSNITFGGLKQYYITKKEKYKKLVIQEKNKSNIKISGTGNKVDINTLSKLGVKLILNGDNNEIHITNDSKISKNLNIIINGSNNKITLGKIIIAQNLNIIIGFPTCLTKNAYIKIGDKSKFVKTEIMLLENDSTLNIGEDCLFSENILIHLSDTHSIFDLEGNLLNYGGHVEIGDRVWCGRDSKILKKSTILNDCIIGGSSVVTSQFKEPHCIIAGNPAKIVKRGITWTCNPPQFSKDLLETTH